MIRRGFWLTVGAATGIYGYRRVSAVGRRLSGRLNPALSPAEPGAAVTQSAKLVQSARLARQGRITAVKAARETYRFTRDVREGMDLYMARRSEPPGSTLSTDRESTDRESTTRESTTREPKDGR
jgi:hypothetical protein